MENRRNFNGNTVGDNAIVSQGDVTHITINATATSNADKAFLREISKTNPVHDKKRILEFNGPLLQESFDWVLHQAEFNIWRYTKDNGVFWIKGDPGKGKTMLLCGIIEDFENEPRSTNLAYFFCQAADYRINTAAAVVGGLISSLLRRHPALLSHIREKYEDGPKRQFDGSNAWVILCDVFQTIIQDPQLTNPICVVDALDECVKDCGHLLNLIIKTSGHAKWLISSRNEKHIERKLDLVPQRLVLELKQNAEYISASIDMYINHHIQKIAALKDDEELQSKTLNILKSKAQGTFLWVALVVEELHNTDHWNVEDVLEAMPKDLENLYGLILSRNNNLGWKKREICQVLLSIVTAAKRPLHLGELLVFINSHWKDSEQFKTTYELRDIRDMTQDCGSILSIREDVIYFIHQSAKDYIEGNAAKYIFSIQHQHYRMFETSLDAMHSVLKYNMYDLEEPGIHIDDIPRRSSDSDPLVPMRYCCVFWVEHLVSGYQFEGFDRQKYLEDDGILHSFLNEKFLCWIESLALMRSFMPHVLTALGRLQSLLTQCYYEMRTNEDHVSQFARPQGQQQIRGFAQFVNDAYRFVIRSHECISSWPLQVYFSAISFEQDTSAVRSASEQAVRDKFGPSFITKNISRRQSSALLRILMLHNLYKARHSSDTECEILFSPDATLMCAFKSSGMIAIYRTDSGRPECTIEIDYQSEVTFLPDSKRLISVSEKGTIKWWSIDTASCIRVRSLDLTKDTDMYRGPSNKVIALSPGGDLVASLHLLQGRSSAKVKIWGTRAADCCCTFTFTCKATLYAAFSPNSEMLALQHGTGVRIHHARTGEMVKYLDHQVEQFVRKGKDECRQPVFSQDSNFLVIVASNLHLSLWRTKTWQLVYRIAGSPLHNLGLRTIAISPDSTTLAMGTDDELKLWSIVTGECVASVTVRSLSATFSPDWAKSSIVASMPGFDMIQLWHLDIDQVMPKVEYSECSAFANVVISPDSRFVASKRNDQPEINIWSVDSCQLIRVLRWDCVKDESLNTYNIHRDSLPIFSPDSELLAYNIGDGGGAIQIWRVITGEPVCFLLERQSANRITSVAFSIDSRYLVAGSEHGEIWIWRIDSSHQGQRVYEYEPDNRTLYLPVSPLTISPDLRRVAAYFGGRLLKIWDWRSGTGIESKSDLATTERKIVFSSDSAVLASITVKSVRIWDVTTGACLRRFNAGRNIHLPSFDPVEGQVRMNSVVFSKTSSWKHWKLSTRVGYSYAYRDDYVDGKGKEAWILLNGKRFFYMPTDLRPTKAPNSDISDSLLTFVNSSGGIVIIKFPLGVNRGTRDLGTRRNFDFYAPDIHQAGKVEDGPLAVNRVTRAIGNEDSIKVLGNLVDRVVVREDGVGDTSAHQTAKDVLHDTAVVLLDIYCTPLWPSDMFEYM